MEIYLSHMVMFRVLEKLHLNTVIGDGWLQYLMIVVMTVTGATVFAVAMQEVLKIVETKITLRKAR